jgi:ribosome-associated translation inhibitor RaiA
MATKKQKREAGIKKQEEALAEVTAKRLEAQEQDRIRREERAAEMKAAADLANEKLDSRLRSHSTAVDEAIAGLIALSILKQGPRELKKRG